MPKMSRAIWAPSVKKLKALFFQGQILFSYIFYTSGIEMSQHFLRAIWARGLNILWALSKFWGHLIGLRARLILTPWLTAKYKLKLYQNHVNLPILWVRWMDCDWHRGGGGGSLTLTWYMAYLTIEGAIYSHFYTKIEIWSIKLGWWVIHSFTWICSMEIQIPESIFTPLTMINVIVFKIFTTFHCKRYFLMDRV